jgi:dihydroflavonol-4-reductase
LPTSTVLITGATGYLGSALVRHLRQTHKGNIQLKALVRVGSERKVLESYGVGCVEGDILNPVSLWNATRDIEVIFHIAALVSFEQKDYRKLYRSNVIGTRNVVNAALRNQVKRLIHTSSTAAIGVLENGSLNTETTEFQEWQKRIGYMSSKYLAEFEILRGIAEGLDAVIVNPGILIGESDERHHSGSRFLVDMYQGRLPFHPKGGSGFIDVRDAAKALEAAWQHGKTGERYVAISENLSYLDLFRLAQSLAGARTSKSSAVTPFLLTCAGVGAELGSVLFRKKAMLTIDTARLSSRTLFYDNAKSRHELGLSYRSVKETIEDLVQTTHAKNSLQVAV